MSDIAKILGQPFDSTTEQASTAWDPLPSGWYNAFIEKEEIRATKAGTGHYLNLQFYIIDKPFNGRKAFANINLSNPSAKCVQIGKADLAALTQALNISLLQDTAQLVNGTVQIRVVIKQDQNEIKGYKPVESIAPASPAPLAPPQALQSPASVTPAANSAATSTPVMEPWKR